MGIPSALFNFFFRDAFKQNKRIPMKVGAGGGRQCTERNMVTRPVCDFWAGPALAGRPHLAFSSPRCSRLRTPRPPGPQKAPQGVWPRRQEDLRPVTSGETSEPVFRCQSPARLAGTEGSPPPGLPAAPDLSLRPVLLGEQSPHLGKKSSRQGNLASASCSSNGLRGLVTGPNTTERFLDAPAQIPLLAGVALP
ncbi:hypothetical protein MDA_GLEAN10018220 [Myotis davidii]|uniref:Uncharacterized protein n=1 Tax=Myotis davidii TaxID=225400 RepID=L5M3T0_MYODS|nr:hypothetical protein MDA_GLEAN10018220 [Myotis davidii]